MKYILALAALTAAVSAQNPPGCRSDFDGYFVIKPTLVNGAEAQVGNEAKMLKARAIGPQVLSIADFITEAAERQDLLPINTYRHPERWRPYRSAKTYRRDRCEHPVPVRQSVTKRCSCHGRLLRLPEQHACIPWQRHLLPVPQWQPEQPRRSFPVVQQPLHKAPGPNLRRG